MSTWQKLDPKEDQTDIVGLEQTYNQVYGHFKRMYSIETGGTEIVKAMKEAKEIKRAFKGIQSQDELVSEILNSVDDGFEDYFKTAVQSYGVIRGYQVGESSITGAKAFEKRMKHLEVVVKGMSLFSERYKNADPTLNKLISDMEKLIKLVTVDKVTAESLYALDKNDRMRSLAFGSAAQNTYFWGNFVGEFVGEKRISALLDEYFNSKVVGTETMKRVYAQSDEKGNVTYRKEAKSGIADIELIPKNGGLGGFTARTTISVKNYDLKHLGKKSGTYSIQKFDFARIMGEIMREGAGGAGLPSDRLTKATATMFHAMRWFGKSLDPRLTAATKAYIQSGEAKLPSLVALYKIFYVIGFHQTFRFGSSDQVMLFLANDKLFEVGNIFPTDMEISKYVGSGASQNLALRKVDTGSRLKTGALKGRSKSIGNRTYGNADSPERYLSSYLTQKAKLGLHISLSTRNRE